MNKKKICFIVFFISSLFMLLMNCVIFYDYSLTESTKLVASLRAEISLYQKNNSELKQLNQVLKDEHQALQLAFTKLEEKLRGFQVNFYYNIVINKYFKLKKFSTFNFKFN